MAAEAKRASLPEGVSPGDAVTAKRLGWDEGLTPEQQFDLESYAEHGYASDELSGALEVIRAPGLTVCLVGGQEADPKTVRPAGEKRRRAAHTKAAPGKGAEEGGAASLDERAELIAEILYGLYGDEALARAEGKTKAWDALQHPRGANGRFIARGSAEAVATAREVIGRVLSGKDPGATSEKVLEHLNLLTVAQLRSLHREHGVKIPGKLRENLVGAVRERLAATAGMKKPAKKPRQPKAPAPAVPGTQLPVPPAGPILMGEPVAKRIEAYAYGKAVAESLADTSTAVNLAREEFREKMRAVAAAGSDYARAMKRHDAAKDAARAGRGSSREDIAAAKEMKEARKRWEEAKAAHEKADAALTVAQDESRRRVTELLRAENPVRFESVFDSYLTPSERKKGEAAAGWIKSVTDWAGNDLERVVHRPVPSDGDQRAFFKGRRHGIHLETVNTAAHDDIGTHVHELGHYLEHNLPGLRQAAQEFLDYRVGNEPVRAMQSVAPDSGYGPDEGGRKDEFDRYFPVSQAYYVGKHYSSGSTEVVSMGLEALYRDPAGFAHKDPEYCAWVVGILKGHLLG